MRPHILNLGAPVYFLIKFYSIMGYIPCNIGKSEFVLSVIFFVLKDSLNNRAVLLKRASVFVSRVARDSGTCAVYLNLKPTNSILGTHQCQKAACSTLLEIFGLKVRSGTPKRLFPSKN